VNQGTGAGPWGSHLACHPFGRQDPCPTGPLPSRPAGATLEEIHAIRFATAIPGPARRHGLDGIAPANRSNRSAAERTGGGARPPARRAAAAGCLRPRIYPPLAACLEDLRPRPRPGGWGGPSPPRGLRPPPL